MASFSIFCSLQYVEKLRTDGEVTFANSAEFLGRCAGTFVIAAIFVFLYDKIRRREPSTPSRLLAISSVACLLSLLVLINSANSSPFGSKRATAAYYQQLLKNPSTPSVSQAPHTKWDPAGRAFFNDLLAQNRRYISEVSKLDLALQPLYTPASFRDAQSIQAILDALGQRLVVAERYSQLAPIFAKMPGYLTTIKATDQEKQEFMEGFNKGVPKALAARKSLCTLENDWLTASIDLYRFALAHKTTFVYDSGKILFKRAADSAVFNEKLNKSQVLNAQFLRAYWASRRAQDAALAQAGLQRSDVGLDNSK